MADSADSEITRIVMDLVNKARECYIRRGDEDHVRFDYDDRDMEQIVAQKVAQIRAVVAALDQTASAGALKVGDLVEWAGAEWIIVVVKEFADIYSERSGATYRVPTSDLKRVEEVSNG